MSFIIFGSKTVRAVRAPIATLDPAPVMAASVAFAGLPVAGATPATPARTPVAAPEVQGGPVAVYLSGRDATWCQTRPGVWWPAQGVWVDRLVLGEDDVAPLGARTYPLVPARGLVIGAVHGQAIDDVAHVLVTGSAGEIITQVAAMFAGPRDLALLVLATLIHASGRSEAPTETMLACLSDRVLRDLGTGDWAAPGWTCTADELPGKVIAALRW